MQILSWFDYLIYKFKYLFKELQLYKKLQLFEIASSLGDIYFRSTSFDKLQSRILSQSISVT